MHLPKELLAHGGLNLWCLCEIKSVSNTHRLSKGAHPGKVHNSTEMK